MFSHLLLAPYRYIKNYILFTTLHYFLQLSWFHTNVSKISSYPSVYYTPTLLIVEMMLTRRHPPTLSKVFRSMLRTFGTGVYKDLLVKKIGRVTCIGINRPSKKNCLNVNVVKELKDAIESFELNDNSSVAVIYGERGNFSNGCDIEEISANPKLLEEIEDIGIFGKYPLKPVVAAVSGYAVGPGFDLALWCDFRMVEDSALLGGYARRFGLPSSDVTVHRLYALLGMDKGMDLVLTGRLIKPDEALHCGIATRVVACGSGLGQAVSFANSLANMPQSCLKADRAAFLSLSDKFYGSTKAFIMEEKIKHRQIAMEEAKQGVHFNARGDVRKKY